jgi:SAM-dependent methyltransferase
MPLVVLGRYAAHLTARSHQVQGFDTSSRMVALARAKVPTATFEVADMCQLPSADASTDIVVNTLAMTHQEQLGPLFAEAARVLRPGGHLLVSDVRGFFLGSSRTPLLVSTASHGFGYIPAWSHSTASYIRASVDNGFVVRDCHELIAPTQDRPEDDPAEPIRTGEPASIWDLNPWAPTAARAVRDDRVCLITWHFQRR